MTYGRPTPSLKLRMAVAELVTSIPEADVYFQDDEAVVITRNLVYRLLDEGETIHVETRPFAHMWEDGLGE